MCASIFSLASSIRILMSDVNSVIWLSNASLTVMLICVSSNSSKRKATDLIPGSVSFYCFQYLLCLCCLLMVAFFCCSWWVVGRSAGEEARLGVLRRFLCFAVAFESMGGY